MDKGIFLAPFTLNSVLLYHQIRCCQEKGGMPCKVVGFFDSNPCLWGLHYGECCIYQPYYSLNNNLVICSDKEYVVNQLKNMYADLGYSNDNYLDYTETEAKTGVSRFVAANLVDDATYMKYRPEKWKAVETGEGYALIKKMRVWSKMEALVPDDNEFSFEDYLIDPRKEVFRDKNGIPHILLKRFELDVTDRCSLKCKNCGAMMQYYKNPKDVPYESVIRDYERLLQIIDWTDDVFIMGGEPFMNIELEKILSAIKDNPLTGKKVGTVKIMTNGTIVPNQGILELLRDSDIVVGISNYKKNSKRLDEIINALYKYSVKHFIVNIPYWKNIEQLRVIEADLNEKQRLLIRRECSTRNRSISYGKFYLCCFLKSAHHLRAVPQYDDMFVDIYSDDAREQIYRYLNISQPAPKACSWCSGDTLEQWKEDRYTIPAAEQISEPLQYKEYDWK